PAFGNRAGGEEGQIRRPPVTPHEAFKLVAVPGLNLGDKHVLHAFLRRGAELVTTRGLFLLLSVGRVVNLRWGLGRRGRRLTLRREGNTAWLRRQNERSEQQQDANTHGADHCKPGCIPGSPLFCTVFVRKPKLLWRNSAY